MNASTILDRLDTIINRDDYTRALGLAVLNESRKWIQNEGNWTFMETLDESQTTVAGTQSYSEPTRFKADIDVAIINVQNQQRFLTEWRGTQMDRGIVNTDQQQRPNFYWYFANALMLFQTPDTTGETIRQRCYCYLADLTDSTGSTDELTDQHANLLIAMTARDIFNIFEDYDAAAIWHAGQKEGGGINFVNEWDAFMKKQGKKQAPSTTPRLRVRMK